MTKITLLMGNITNKPSIHWLPLPKQDLQRKLEAKGVEFINESSSSANGELFGTRVKCPLGWGYLKVKRNPDGVHGWLVDNYRTVVAAIAYDTDGALVTKCCRPYLIDMDRWILKDGEYQAAIGASIAP